MRRIIYLTIIVLAISFLSCNKTPTCSFLSPEDFKSFQNTDTLTIEMKAEDEDGSIASIKLLIDNNTYTELTHSPFKTTIFPGELTVGNHILTIQATDNKGETSESSISITIIPHIYAIGDYYHVNTVEGIVYRISNSGANGMILSLDFNNLQWANDEFCAILMNASSDDDGLYNYNAIMESNFGIQNFPAFKWCNDKNTGSVTGWHLPAINDIQLVSDSMDVISKAYTNLGLSSFDNSTIFWSSTEASGINAWGMYNHFQNEIIKSTYNTVIAVKKF